MFPFSAVIVKVASVALSALLTFGAAAPAFVPSGGCVDFKAHSFAATYEVSSASANATNDAPKSATPLVENPVAPTVVNNLSDALESVWNDADHYCFGAWSNSCANMWKVRRRDTNAVVGVCWQNYTGGKFHGLTNDGTLVFYADGEWLALPNGLSSGYLFYVKTTEGIGVVRMEENGDVVIRVPSIARGSQFGDGEYAVVLGKGCASVTQCQMLVYTSATSAYVVDGIRLTWRQSSYPYQEVSVDIQADEAVALGAPRTFGALAG